MNNLEPVFSFNWTTWPFVEVGDSKSPTLQEFLPENLVHELKCWSLDFLANFDEKTGFSSCEAKTRVNSEYERLCVVLKNLGIKFRAHDWWSSI